ncbi:iron-hydroxamate ABC transporter substrate-binding protein [Paenibacillus ehimensis]|uniref:iron-hydroxamate ABC transporter substrate-binding protein n=1 Tax=Paenibacillus ehimensis TaxID=79264 RepID=UPI002DB59CA4|nr:iron-hydroxamate ABC transporter substrate-binding protein [Paenibacillus ehimensis]MEC0210273.1 iron-hydroxamate ABC transporter substrate-binding protein [Paenibacillus ehimensis]
MVKNKPLWAAGLIFLLLVTLLSACGGAATTAGDPAPAKQTGKEPSKEKPAATRSFATVKGNIEIPVQPKRIVTDYYGGELLSVGANVVGVEPTTFDNPFLKKRLTGVVDVGTPVNVEKTLELAPDLIVVMYDKNYEELSKIAPTLHIPYGTTSNIYEAVRLFGDIAGEPQKAEQFIAAFDHKAAQGREKLKGVIDPNATFGLYELTDKGTLWVFGDNAGRGGQTVYNALGLKMPDLVRSEVKGNTGSVQLSMEVLPDYAADYMFLTTYDPEKKGEALRQLQASLVWQGLNAVKNNTLFMNDFDTFYRYDPIAVMGQIDLIVDMLLARAEENKANKN